MSCLTASKTLTQCVSCVSVWKVLVQCVCGFGSIKSIDSSVSCLALSKHLRSFIIITTLVVTDILVIYRMTAYNVMNLLLNILSIEFFSRLYRDISRFLSDISRFLMSWQDLDADKIIGSCNLDNRQIFFYYTLWVIQYDGKSNIGVKKLSITYHKQFSAKFGIGSVVSICQREVYFPLGSMHAQTLLFMKMMGK